MITRIPPLSASYLRSDRSFGKGGEKLVNQYPSPSLYRHSWLSHILGQESDLEAALQIGDGYYYGRGGGWVGREGREGGRELGRSVGLMQQQQQQSLQHRSLLFACLL